MDRDIYAKLIAKLKTLVGLNADVTEVKDDVTTLQSDVTALNGKIGVIDLGEITDLNIPLTTALDPTRTYRFSFANNATNAPSNNDGGYGFLGFNPYSRNYGRMIVFRSGGINTRALLNGEYGDWKLVTIT